MKKERKRWIGESLLLGTKEAEAKPKRIAPARARVYLASFLGLRKAS